MELKKGHRFYLHGTTLAFLRAGFFPKTPYYTPGEEVTAATPEVCGLKQWRCMWQKSPFGGLLLLGRPVWRLAVGRCLSNGGSDGSAARGCRAPLGVPRLVLEAKTRTQSGAEPLVTGVYGGRAPAPRRWFPRME